jgi:hypothetical protein
MKVPLVISELNTKAVIDTGAEVTVLSEAFYFNIPENKRPKLASFRHYPLGIVYSGCIRH